MAQLSITELAELVSEMRKIQRLFFHCRDRSLVPRAKELERRVDEACEAILSHQPKLFE